MAAGGVTINTLCSPCSLWLATSPNYAQNTRNTRPPEAYTIKIESYSRRRLNNNIFVLLRVPRVSVLKP